LIPDKILLSKQASYKIGALKDSLITIYISFWHVSIDQIRRGDADGLKFFRGSNDFTITINTVARLIRKILQRTLLIGTTLANYSLCEIICEQPGISAESSPINSDQ
jgi:hypothetical protein